MTAVPVFGLALSLIVSEQSSSGEIAWADTPVLVEDVYDCPSLAAYLVAESHSRHNGEAWDVLHLRHDAYLVVESNSRNRSIGPTFDSTNRADLPSSNPLSTGNHITE